MVSASPQNLRMFFSSSFLRHCLMLFVTDVHLHQKCFLKFIIMLSAYNRNLRVSCLLLSSQTAP